VARCSLGLSSAITDVVGRSGRTVRQNAHAAHGPASRIIVISNSAIIIRAPPCGSLNAIPKARTVEIAKPVHRWARKDVFFNQLKPRCAGTPKTSIAIGAMIVASPAPITAPIGERKKTVEASAQSAITLKVANMKPLRRGVIAIYRTLASQ